MTREVVPAHVRHAPRADAPDRAVEELEAGAALLALAEEELHADADPEHRPAGGDAVADRVVEAVRGEPARGALDVADAGDHRERRLAHGSGVGRDRRLGTCPREGGGDRAQVAGAVVGEHDLSRDALGRADAAVAGRDRLPQRLAERLERGLGDVMVVGAGRLDVHGAAGLHREPLERVRQQREGEAADALAREGERDLGVRAPDEVDGRRRAGLVHRHDGRAVARDSLARAERLLDGAAERGEDVLDRVVLVDVEVAAGDAVEVEPGVEGEQRQQVVEKPDPGRDVRPAAAVERRA